MSEFKKLLVRLDDLEICGAAVSTRLRDLEDRLHYLETINLHPLRTYQPPAVGPNTIETFSPNTTCI